MQNELKICKSTKKLLLYLLVSLGFVGLFLYLVLTNEEGSSTDLFTALLLLVFTAPGIVIARNKPSWGVTYVVGALFAALMGLYFWQGILGLYLVSLSFFVLSVVVFVHMIMRSPHQPDIHFTQNGFSVYTGLLGGHISGNWNEVSKLTVSNVVMRGNSAGHLLSVGPVKGSDIFNRYPKLGNALSRASTNMMGTPINVGLIVQSQVSDTALLLVLWSYGLLYALSVGIHQCINNVLATVIELRNGEGPLVAST